MSHIHPVDEVVNKVTNSLQLVKNDEQSPVKAKRLHFLTRQLRLFCNKTFTLQDYCFAIESFPHCNYDQLRDVLVLPSKRKLQAVISATDVDTVLGKTFQKTNSEQKHCMLLVDEVKICHGFTILPKPNYEKSIPLYFTMLFYIVGVKHTQIMSTRSKK